ncbi:MFS family permease [Nocardioides zeae]|uniref:MFS family permease n=2 Tax=Nocardioides zeae TaxID=1457234 RepID=A0ACC6ILD2_9ACTN|nr:MFS transporter [Nocardioides zeae]MDQ1106334.1 MFS family permease [Nocardioides zeae]MDR6173980.1 MFS family permease [Nocardioides zeae]MDR6211465.1 MFS family permease [Nocardioides zeae]
MPAATPGRARRGVALMFFTNGVLYSALLPRYPEIKAALDLSNTAFGLVVVAFPAGAVAAAAMAAPVVRRFGAPTVTAVGSGVLAAAMAVAGFHPSVLVLVAALALGGIVDAVVDAAQNVQGVAVERWAGRSIINSLHAIWSLGAATGGVIGAFAAAQDVAIGTQMIVNGIVWTLVAVLGSWLAVLPPAAAPIADALAETPAPAAGRWTALRLVLPLVVLAICGTLVEDVSNNWAVLYLGTEAGAPVGTAALALTVVLVSQFVGRLVGDPMTDRWGREAVARSGGLLIAAGMALAMLPAPYPVAFLGFALMGFGSATLVPAAFAAADRVPGLPAGTGIALLGWLMRIGFLVTSPAVGALSDVASLRVALLIPLAAGLLAAVLSHRAAQGQTPG